MAAKSKTKGSKSSKVVKPQKNPKYTTATTNKHRFQSFSQRIANLKIDPIRRRRNAEEREEISDDTVSYFGRSLREWADLNLSQTFTRFAKDAIPLSENLPMVLHNQDAIMDKLMAYIEMEDALALEALLSLLSHFAHDLDVRFERHFQKAVATVTAVAARHQDPAVVEWSFACLAWLFKYLSRLLAPDLRPLYDIMGPYLGKQNQKPFVIRFAAESLSFLVRKAAAVYEKDAAPLDNIVGHVFDDCARNDKGYTGDLQRQGIMTLFTEAMKGVRGGLHSSAISVLQSLLQQTYLKLDNHFDIILDLVAGVLTSLIHFSNADTFHEVQKVTINHIGDITEMKSTSQIKFGAQIILVIAAVRKGTRIADWAPLLSTLKAFVCTAQDPLDLYAGCRSTILAALAVVLQNCPIENVLQYTSVIQRIRTGSWTQYFLPFCDLFARLDQERFKTFLLPQLQQFITQNWKDRESDICFLIDILDESGISPRLTCPDGMQDAIIELCDVLGDAQLGHSTGDTMSAELVLAALPHLVLKDDRRKRLCFKLFQKTKDVLAKKSESLDTVCDSTLGSGLAALLVQHTDKHQLLEMWPMLCNQSLQFLHFPKFWLNLSKYIKLCAPTVQDMDQELAVLKESLLQCLTLPSNEIRLAALEILKYIYENSDQTVPTTLETAIRIESTPITLESSRSISLDIRKLSSETSHGSGDDTYLEKVLIAFCFGILQYQLSQAWDNSISALAELSKTSTGNSFTATLAQQWLQSQTADTREDDDIPAPRLDINSFGFHVTSDFECSNLAKVSAINTQVFGISFERRRNLNNQAPTRISPNSEHLREQALRVLNRLPKLAEKCSRMLVPVLLRWAANADRDADFDAQATRYSRKHQKSLLSVFAKFTNPKALYRTTEVHTALLNLCGHGDIEIQQSALNAVLAWKDQSVNKYEEHLKNLLDESRFRDELSAFLQDGEEGDVVKRSEDHPALMSILLRLLYGRAIAGGKHGQDTRRRAIFGTISRFSDQTIDMFVDIILGPTSHYRLIEQNEISEQSLNKFSMPPRKQLGMLNMIHDLIETMGPALDPFSEKLLEGILLSTISASRGLSRTEDTMKPGQNELLRSVRQIGLQSLVLVYSKFQDVDLSRYNQIIWRELYFPRLDNFATENTQAVSAVLRLLSAWSVSDQMARNFVANESVLIGKMQELFSGPNTKDTVRLFVLQKFLDNLIQDETEGLLSHVHVASFVRGIGVVLKRQPSNDVVDACVNSFTLLANRIESSVEAQEVVMTCTEMLFKPNKEISPSTKSGLLKTILPLLENFEIASSSQLRIALCGLFSRLRDPLTRVLLATVFFRACQSSPELAQSASICVALNAVTGLADPDHERREQSFTEIFETHKLLTPVQWEPIVHNCLFYIRDADDIVNRSSASRALQLFINTIDHEVNENRRLVTTVLIPGIEYGMKEASELVRSEYLLLLDALIRAAPSSSPLNDMIELTVNGDEEASFFTNVLHIQHHRRLRALRRLAEDSPKLSSGSASRIFLPLLEHFIFDAAEGDAGRTLLDQAIVTVAAVASVLKWSIMRSYFRRYASLLKSHDDHEKAILRLLSALVDAMRVSSSKNQLADTPDNSQRIMDDFVPPLMEYLHHKDESTVDRRLGVAVSIVKLLTLLPENEKSARLAPVLTDVCQVLRSRSVEARDQARKTLAATLSVVGYAYFGFVLRELRSALQRGYQLHVLSFTAHSLLVHSMAALQCGDLDHCLHELTLVIMDDIFGVTGQEKDAEEYKSGMKEVKTSKSFDTMELLARLTPVRRLSQLIRPIQELLGEKLDSSMLKKIDDLLNRVRRGVDQNSGAEDRDILVFCHELIRLVSPQQSKITETERVNQRISKYLPATELYNKTKSKPATTIYRYKLVSFALNLLRKVLRRHEDLLTSSNVSGFLPIAGDALVQGHEEVQVAAIKLLSTVMKLPLPELNDNAPVYVQEAVQMIESANSMTSDLAKSSLELITAVIRERRSVQIRDKDMARLLKAIKNEIDEPDRQGIIYRFLRAVLGKKIMATEVYEVMDAVSRVFVTNADHNIRENARSAYLQFVMDYPQGKDRWNKQAAFFVQNLKYERPAGRQSVMELLHQLLTKLGDEVLEVLDFTLFVALIPVQISDSEESCRHMATILIGKLFERASDEKFSTMLALMNKWLQNEGNQAIRAAALACWQTVLTKRTPQQRQVEALRDTVGTILDQHAANSGISGKNLVIDHALQTITTMAETVPVVAFASNSSGLWDTVPAFIKSPSSEISTAAARLLELLLSDFARTNAKTEAGLSVLPMRGSRGLELSADDFHGICQSSLRALQTRTDINEELAAQFSRHLVFVGRCFFANSMVWNKGPDEPEEVDEEADDTAEAIAPASQSALDHLFHRLAYIVRQDRLPTSSRTAALQCQATLLNNLSDVPRLHSVLRSLYLLTDPSIPQPPGEDFQVLSDNARDLLTVIEKKIGTDTYLKALGLARSQARARRDERRQKRRIEAVSAPERWAKSKKKKHEHQKAKLKAKSAEARGRRRAW